MILYYFPIAQTTVVNKTVSEKNTEVNMLVYICMYSHILHLFLFTGLIPV